METILLPDGTTIQIPSNMSTEDRKKLALELYEKSKGSPVQTEPIPKPQAVPSTDPYLAAPPRSTSLMDQYRATRPGGTGIASLAREEEPEEGLGEGGTLAGSAWEGLKSIPRGARQFGLMALQGIEGLRTPDEDTQREKDLRLKLQNLMEEIDPKYRDSNLAQVGMGLGQAAAMVGTSFIPHVGPVAAASGAMLMMAGDAAGRIAEYEERTGEDVSKAKEVFALGAGLGLGLTEMMPLTKYARRSGLFGKAAKEATELAVENVALMSGKKFAKSLLPSAIRQAGAEGLQEGLSGFGQSATARLLYDEDALAHAGSESLREALIGGQVGAITDVVMKMAFRGRGLAAMKRRDYLTGKQLAETFQKELDEGGFGSGSAIRDLVSGPDMEAIKADILERVQRKELSPEAAGIEMDEALEREEHLATVRQAILRDPVTKMSEMEERHSEQVKREREENQRAFENDEYGKDAEGAEAEFNKREEQIGSKESSFNREIGLLQASIDAEGTRELEAKRIAELTDEEFADEQPTIEEINEENSRINRRRGQISELQKEIENREREEGLAPKGGLLADLKKSLLESSDDYRALSDENLGLEQKARGNATLVERLKQMEGENLPATIESMADKVDFEGGQVESQLALEVLPTLEDTEIEAIDSVNRQIGNLGAAIEAEQAPLIEKEAQLQEMERSGITGVESKAVEKAINDKRQAESLLSKFTSPDPDTEIRDDDGNIIQEAEPPYIPSPKDILAQDGYLDEQGNPVPQLQGIDENGDPIEVDDRLGVSFPTGKDKSGAYTYDKDKPILSEFQKVAAPYQQAVITEEAILKAHKDIASADATINEKGIEPIYDVDGKLRPEFEGVEIKEGVKYAGPLINNLQEQIKRIRKKVDKLKDSPLVTTEQVTKEAVLDGENNVIEKEETQTVATSGLRALLDPEYRKQVIAEKVARYKENSMSLVDQVGRLVTDEQRNNLYKFVFDPNDPSTWPPEIRDFGSRVSRDDVGALASEAGYPGWSWNKQLGMLAPIGWKGVPKDRKMTAREVRDTVKGILGGGLNTMWKQTGSSIQQGTWNYAVNEKTGQDELTWFEPKAQPEPKDAEYTVTSLSPEVTRYNRENRGRGDQIKKGSKISGVVYKEIKRLAGTRFVDDPTHDKLERDIEKAEADTLKIYDKARSALEKAEDAVKTATKKLKNIEKKKYKNKKTKERALAKAKKALKEAEAELVTAKKVLAKAKKALEKAGKKARQAMADYEAKYRRKKGTFRAEQTREAESRKSRKEWEKELDKLEKKKRGSGYDRMDSGEYLASIPNRTYDHRIRDTGRSIVYQAPTSRETGQKRVPGPTEQGGEQARGAYNEVFSWWAQLGIARDLAEKSIDTPLPPKLKKRFHASLGILARSKFAKLAQRLRDSGYNITEDVLVEALQLKNFDVKSVQALRDSDFFSQLLGDTLGMGADYRIQPGTWENLTRGEKEMVLSRILRTKAQPDNTKAGQAERVRRKDIRRLQLNPGALPKSRQEQMIDRDSLTEAKTRFDKFKKEIVPLIVKELGLSPKDVVFTADIDLDIPQVRERDRNRLKTLVDNIKTAERRQEMPDPKHPPPRQKTIDAWRAERDALEADIQKTTDEAKRLGINDLLAQIDDVVVNGAYEIERNDDGTPRLDENNDVIFRRDAEGQPVFRPGYRDGAVASLQNHGTRIVFNLSQIVDKYPDGIDTDPDILRKDILAHEGTHMLFLRNDLTTSERRILERYGKSKKVPKEVDEDAHEAGLTWRQWVEETYGDQSDVLVTEETSVRILDALAMGQISEAQSAGAIGNIKREAIGMFKAIVGASQDSDILPVLDVFKDIQSGAIVKRRALKEAIEGPAGATALWFAERADPEDLKELHKAMKEGDQVKVDEISKRIVHSREEFVDEKSPEERLMDSLTAELRARKEIEDTPTRVVQPVLNQRAIEQGLVSTESLNAYFTFMDGRKPPHRMPVGDRDWRWKRTHVTHVPNAALSSLRERMHWVSSDSATGGEGIIDALGDHERMPDGAYYENSEEFKVLIKDYSRRQFLRRRLFDKRLPQLLSSKRAMERKVTKYGKEDSAIKLHETALGRLAETSAIAAWRMADNALNFMPAVMKEGMLSYANGGFNVDQLYVQERNPETGEWQDKLGTDGNPIEVKSLFDIFKPILELGKEGEELTNGYMAALRVKTTHDMMKVAEARLTDAMAAGVVDLSQLRRDVDDWTDAYNRANPRQMEDGEVNKQFMKEEEWTDAINEVENNLHDPVGAAIKEFADRYAEFNHHLIEFAHQTGSISRTQADMMLSVVYIPFYRDLGWENNDTMVNPNNEYVIEEDSLEGEEGERLDNLRGEMLIDKSLSGSFAPINNDLFGNITRNVNSLIRDGMNNVAVGRTMRDELRAGTAVEIPQVSKRDKNRLRILNKKVRNKKYRLPGEDIGDIKKERDALKESMQKTIDEAKRLNIQLNKKNFSEILVKVKGVTVQLDDRDPAKIEARMRREGRIPDDATPKDVEELVKNEPAREDGEIVFSDKSDIEQQGELKVYRVMDPQLSRSMMDVGFSPKQAIEDFFHKNIGLPQGFSAGLSNLLVGASRVLREAVTRSPPFIIKNTIRDAMQASVSYGGGPAMFFKILHRFVTDPNLIRDAERRGLGIGVDWSPDPKDAGKSFVRMMKKEQMSWDTPTDWMAMAWDGLGRMTKRSEVAARMVVYDDVIARKGSAAEATNQGIEIINYGRRGSSPLFSVLTAMAPFMNGRIQGLDVIYRSHMGYMDGPNREIMDEGLQLDDAGVRWQRGMTTFMRGQWIMLATMLYYFMVHDDEEYKNAREDQKNDWWLIPLGGNLPGIKIPIPFEVGTLYKVIPEQIMRAYMEEEHDLQDVRGEIARQLKGALMLDLRPQLIRPVIDALTNKDAYQRDDIVPSWMENTVASTEHYNPYTNRVARLLGDVLADVPFLQNVDFLTSPMKLEYMMRQYTGTLGSYGMALADRLTREIMGENIIGTAADFGFTSRTWANLPMLGDLVYDPQKGGGYQEDFYELIEDIDKLVTTVGQIEESRGREAAEEYKQEHSEYFENKSRLRHFEKRMKHYREDRNRLFERTDLSNDDKRRHLYRMFENRDDILDEMVKIMGDIREERSLTEQFFGTRP